jgi:hypothetical protein
MHGVHARVMCGHVLALVAIPFTATEVRRSRVLVGVRNQERSETMSSLAGYLS